MTTEGEQMTKAAAYSSSLVKSIQTNKQIGPTSETVTGVCDAHQCVTGPVAANKASPVKDNARVTQEEMTKKANLKVWKRVI